ncbi:MAG TPA: glycosyltransferase family 4 protein, partial [Balneolaceae bacterium]|nr:glycosyltransferase family 4 protein [Balneolaceae bacterium]
MRILFITDNFPPEVNAPATRTYEHCKRWVDMGAEVTVITCVPNFPQGQVYEGYSNRLIQKEIIDGIQVIRVWSYIAANKGFIKRALDYISFAFSSFWAGLFRRSDVIIATSPQFFTTWTACALSTLKREPWVFELRDLWPESIKAVGALEDGLIYDILEKIELFLYDHADLIIPNTPAFKDRLIERGVDQEKIRVIPNGANLKLFKPQKKNEKLVANLGLEEKFVVGYLGTHGLAHNLDFILECAASLNEPELFFLFIGDGAEKGNLKRQAKRLLLNNVRFLDPVPKKRVPAYLSVFDVALVPLKKSDTFKTVIPSKIFEAAAMRKPILLGVEGQAKKIIEKYKAGLCYEPENKEDFIHQLKTLKEDSVLYETIS